MPTTPRGAFPYPSLSDPADVPADLQELCERLDAIVALADQGPLGSRPAAGNRGRFYLDTSSNTMYYDTGTQWVALNSIGGAGVSDGPANTATLRSLGTGALQAASGADARLSDQRVPTDNSVTAAKIHTGLKPSAGAGSATEALRAIGFGTGQVAAGTHAAQHGSGGSDPLTVTPAMLQAGPRCLISQYDPFTVSTDGTAIPFDIQDYDTANMWTLGIGKDNAFSVPYAGHYNVTVTAAFNPNSTRGSLYVGSASNYLGPEIQFFWPNTNNDGYESVFTWSATMYFQGVGDAYWSLISYGANVTCKRIQLAVNFAHK